MNTQEMDTMFSSKSNEWETPEDLFKNLDKDFHFTLDPAATHKNHKCPKYFTVKENGLTHSWQGETVFLNPPYGRDIGKWVEKAYLESKLDNNKKVLLIPARTDTKYFSEYCSMAARLYFIQGRLKFSNSKNSAPFPSVVVVFEDAKSGRHNCFWTNKDFTRFW